jgi:hypothetical protein
VMIRRRHDRIERVRPLPAVGGLAHDSPYSRERCNSATTLAPTSVTSRSG